MSHVADGIRKWSVVNQRRILNTENRNFYFSFVAVTPSQSHKSSYLHFRYFLCKWTSGGLDSKRAVRGIGNTRGYRIAAGAVNTGNILNHFYVRTAHKLPAVLGQTGPNVLLHTSFLMWFPKWEIHVCALYKDRFYASLGLLRLVFFNLIINSSAYTSHKQ